MVNIYLTRLIKSGGPGSANRGSPAGRVQASANREEDAPPWSPRRPSGLLVALLALPEKARNEPGERGCLTGTELDRPARRHRQEAETRHLLRRVSALGDTCAHVLQDGAPELLGDHPADDIDGADQPGTACESAQQMDGAGEAGALAEDLGDLTNQSRRSCGKKQRVEQHGPADRPVPAQSVRKVRAHHAPYDEVRERPDSYRRPCRATGRGQGSPPRRRSPP